VVVGGGASSAAEEEAGEEEVPHRPRFVGPRGESVDCGVSGGVGGTGGAGGGHHRTRSVRFRVRSR
jgi:hypothetical protein